MLALTMGQVAILVGTDHGTGGDTGRTVTTIEVAILVGTDHGRGGNAGGAL